MPVDNINMGFFEFIVFIAELAAVVCTNRLLEVHKTIFHAILARIEEFLD
jgi:hypothetical protein